jgi:hypothetical protein
MSITIHWLALMFFFLLFCNENRFKCHFEKVVCVAELFLASGRKFDKKNNIMLSDNNMFSANNR